MSIKLEGFWFYSFNVPKSTIQSHLFIVEAHFICDKRPYIVLFFNAKNSNINTGLVVHSLIAFWNMKSDKM